MIIKKLSLPAILSVIFFLLTGLSVSAQVKYIDGHNNWNADSLGNHRAVVNVQQNGKAAEVTIEWRRRDNPTGKMIFVVDAKSDKLVANVKSENISREKGTVIFEPVSGSGTYYVYYMPFHVKPGSNYPNAIYLTWKNTASDEWLNSLASAQPVAAKLEYLESINKLNTFYPMEVIATDSEEKQLIAANSAKPYLVIPEDRMHPIKMKTDLPQRWILKGISNSFTDTAAKGENFAWQLGVYAFAGDLHNVHLKFGDLKSSNGAVLRASLFSSLNTDGINWDNSILKKTVDVNKSEIQPMWCLLNVPLTTIAGTYSGTVTVLADGQPATPIKVILTISNKTLPDGGINQPWKQTRLTWLNSSLGQKNEIIKPYIPLKIKGNAVDLLGRRLLIGNDGLPEQIQTFFTEEMTGTSATPRSVLASPFKFIAELTNGEPVKWAAGKPVITQPEPGKVEWTASSTSANLLMKVNGALEFDGFAHYSIMIIALKDVELKDIRMLIPFKKDVAQYMMGLNLKGEKMPASYDWKWDVAHKNQDGAWIGDVNAGLQFSLRDQHYVRPLNTNFYLDKPLLLPLSWGNNDKGGISVAQTANTVQVNNYSGERTMKKGDTLYYNFNLMITPFHALNTEQQWALRFYHSYNKVDSIKATGATVINIHHATPINPYINYPFIAHDAMKGYIDSAHQLGLKVKIYNTVRELSNSAYEIAPLRSLGHEIYSTGKGGGYAWLQEHLGGDYLAAWYVPEIHDAAVVNSGMSRWHNYYVEGMNWLVNNVGIDGIYLDDVAYDRTTMKRIKRVLTQNGHPGIIDLHSANQYNKRDGFNNSANLYMDHFPYLNRLWFGEYFDYEHNDPDFFMTEVSGIPFGLMGEMLQGGGNPWRGMIYGMTNRMPWSDNADPRPIWREWDKFGIKGSRMIGYWVKSKPVKTNDPMVLATVYKRDKKVMVSIASWAETDKNIKLMIDWKALNLNPSKATITAPAMKNFQPGRTFGIDEEIPVEKAKGWLLVIAEK